MALELKTPRDDITRGIGQLTEALVYGYDRAALVTTLRNTKSIDKTVFDRFGIAIFGIDSGAKVHQVKPALALSDRSPVATNPPADWLGPSKK